MEIKYFDIHSHFNLPQFAEDLPAAIKKMEDEATATICVGTDLRTSRKAVEIAQMSQNIWATVGQHPTDTDEPFDPEAFLELAKHPKVVAIGECGFDYFRAPKDVVFERQKAIFLEQVKIARDLDKPLMIHARPSKKSMDAYEDVLKILSDFSSVRANFHFFVGDVQIAREASKRGYTMSFDGPITFSRDYDEVIRTLPLENIMAETDAPFAAPEPYRSQNRAAELPGAGKLSDTERPNGKAARCEPWMVREVVAAIARVRNQDENLVRETMIENARRFFTIPS